MFIIIEINTKKVFYFFLILFVVLLLRKKNYKVKKYINKSYKNF